MEKLKIILALLIVFALLVSPSYAANNTGEIKVMLNGSPVYFDPPPNLKNGVTLIPVRGLFESLHSVVTWDPETRSVFISSGDRAIAMQVGRDKASVNGQTVSLQRSPEIISGRTFVPLRFIAEALGARVHWDGKNRTVRITTNVPKLTPDGTPIDQVPVPPGY